MDDVFIVVQRDDDDTVRIMYGDGGHVLTMPHGAAKGLRIALQETLGKHHVGRSVEVTANGGITVNSPKN